MDVLGEVGDGGVAVDDDGFERGVEAFVEVADPGDGPDGVQAEVEELGLGVEFVGPHLELLGEHLAEHGGDGGDIGGGKKGLLRGGGAIRDVLGGGWLGSEVLLDACQNLRLMHERGLVEGEFLAEDGLQAEPERGGHAAFPPQEPGSRPGGEGLGLDHGFGQDLGSGQGRGLEAAPLPVASGAGLGGQEVFGGKVATQPFGQDQGGSRAGGEAEVQIGAAVAALLVEHDLVGEQGQGEAGAQGMALHGGDDGKRAVEGQPEDRGIGEAGLAGLDGEQALLGPPGGEEGTVSGEHDDAESRVGGHAVEGLDEALDQGG